MGIESADRQSRSAGRALGPRRKVTAAESGAPSGDAGWDVTAWDQVLLLFQGNAAGSCQALLWRRYDVPTATVGKHEETWQLSENVQLVPLVDESVLDVGSSVVLVDTLGCDRVQATIAALATSTEVYVAAVGVTPAEGRLLGGGPRIKTYLKEVLDFFESAGLEGRRGSLGSRIATIEEHLHHREYWFGKAVTPSGETHVADRVGSAGVVPFQIDAGNDVWGNWVQVLGSADTPVLAGEQYFDPHRILVTNTEKAAPYIVQFGWGASGAAALTANQTTEVPFGGSVGIQNKGPSDVGCYEIATGTKFWARAWCQGQDTGAISFLLGIHEYEG